MMDCLKANAIWPAKSAKPDAKLGAEMPVIAIATGRGSDFTPDTARSACNAARAERRTENRWCQPKRHGAAIKLDSLGATGRGGERRKVAQGSFRALGSRGGRSGQDQGGGLASGTGAGWGSLNGAAGIAGGPGAADSQTSFT